MALRVVTVHLLVAVLLACPFPCLEKAAARSAAPQIARAKCAGRCCCCGVPRCSPAKPGPVQPDRGDCGTCLCHGAVLEPHVQAPSPQAGPELPAASGDRLLNRATVAAWDGPAAHRPICHFPWADSGRMLRARVESLLL